MPTYEYEDTRTGETVELFRHVDERHDVPRHLKLIISRGHGGVATGCCDERDPDAAVPRALKQLTNAQANQLVKESGFSRDHFKRVWAMGIAIALLFQFPAFSQDLTQGYIFQPNQANINSAEMNAIVGGAVINPQFYTAKSAAAPSASDIFLFYSVSANGFRKSTLNNMVLGNTSLITGQSEDTTLATNDFVLTYDTSAAGFKKAALDTLWRQGIGIYPQIGTSNLQQSAKVVVNQGGTNATVSMHDFLPQYGAPFTNLNQTVTSLESNQFLIYEASTGTNARIRADVALCKGFPAWDYSTTFGVESNISGLRDWIPVWGQSDAVSPGFKRLNIDTMVLALYYRGVAGAYQLPAKFQSFDYALASGVIVNTNHSLGATPEMSRWVLYCTVNDTGGWLVGDEVPIEAFHLGTGGTTNSFGCGANTTNVWLTCQSTTMATRSKTNGADMAITAARWNARNYSVHFRY